MEGFDSQSLDFLTASERQAVARYIKEIKESNSSLFKGKRIAELRTILSPYGYFTKAIAALNLVQRTAYGYMYGYRNAVEMLPAGAVQAMMDRNLIVNSNRDKLGEWTDVVAEMPPPASGSAAAYERWVDALIAAKPKRMTGVKANRMRRDPDQLFEDCVQIIQRSRKRLPANRGAVERFGKRLAELVVMTFELDPGKFQPQEAKSRRMA